MKDFFELDKYRLDQEWVEQPALFYKHAMMLADARMKHEQAKADLEVVDAELARDIRANPTMFGLPDKAPSVDVVEKTIILEASHARARDAVIKAKHEVDVCQAAVETLEHRKKALENSVHLWAMDYYSEPRVKDNDKARDKVQKAERRRAFGGTRED